MGKEIAPREEESAPVAKRDIAGFDRALRYAEVALQAGPKVQLGTGKEGSGVGIIVDNNQVAAARAGTGNAEGARPQGVAAPAPAAPAGGAERKKRDVESAPKAVRAKVTTMYVRSGIPACESLSHILPTLVTSHLHIGDMKEPSTNLFSDSASELE